MSKLMRVVAPTDSDRVCFLAAKMSGVIDFVAFENAAHRSIPRSLVGTVKRHGDGFTVHDPVPTDLMALATFKPCRAEISIDLKPERKVQGDARRSHFESIYRFIARRIWPFGWDGIQRSYRVSSAKNVAHPPCFVDEDGCATDPRLPELHETEYIGNTSDFLGRVMTSNNWGQVRLYFKTIDQGQQLPDEQHRVRMEVTIDSDGLRELGIGSTIDLCKINFRRTFSNCFRMLRPDAVEKKVSTVKKRNLHLRDTLRVRAIRNQAAMLNRKLLAERAEEGGFVSLMKDASVVINDHRGDAMANRKIAEALDNLSRRHANVGRIAYAVIPRSDDATV